MSIVYGKTNEVPKHFDGCDFVVDIEENRKVKILQLTDMQIIDALQQRYPDRLRDDEARSWMPEYFDALFGDHARSVISQTKPDLIFLTGDLVYGQFDDKGTSLIWFCNFMDSFGIPWAPVFGNHDNESTMGVAWQCQRLKNSKHCLFKRGNVSGNGNYTVGVAIGNKLKRILYMTDSNGCKASTDDEVIKEKGIYPDQVKYIEDTAKTISKAQGKTVPGFMAFHIPTDIFLTAPMEKGYYTEDNPFCIIDVEIPGKDGDFGCYYREMHEPDIIKMPQSFYDMLKANGIDGLFTGHFHRNNTVIHYDGFRLVFGLKTGQYDDHLPGHLGGTLVTLEDDDFSVQHVPALCIYGAYPGKAPMFNNFFV